MDANPAFGDNYAIFNASPYATYRHGNTLSIWSAFSFFNFPASINTWPVIPAPDY